MTIVIAKRGDWIEKDELFSPRIDIVYTKSGAMRLLRCGAKVLLDLVNRGIIKVVKFGDDDRIMYDAVDIRVAFGLKYRDLQQKQFRAIAKAKKELFDQITILTNDIINTKYKLLLLQLDQNEILMINVKYEES